MTRYGKHAVSRVLNINLQRLKRISSPYYKRYSAYIATAEMVVKLAEKMPYLAQRKAAELARPQPRRTPYLSAAIIGPDKYPIARLEQRERRSMIPVAIVFDAENEPIQYLNFIVRYSKWARDLIPQGAPVAEKRTAKDGTEFYYIPNILDVLKAKR